MRSRGGRGQGRDDDLTRAAESRAAKLVIEIIEIIGITEITQIIEITGIIEIKDQLQALAPPAPAPAAMMPGMQPRPRA